MSKFYCNCAQYEIKCSRPYMIDYLVCCYCNKTLQVDKEEANAKLTFNDRKKRTERALTELFKRPIRKHAKELCTLFTEQLKKLDVIAHEVGDPKVNYAICFGLLHKEDHNVIRDAIIFFTTDKFWSGKIVRFKGIERNWYYYLKSIGGVHPNTIPTRIMPDV